MAYKPIDCCIYLIVYSKVLGAPSHRENSAFKREAYHIQNPRHSSKLGASAAVDGSQQGYLDLSRSLSGLEGKPTSARDEGPRRDGKREDDG